MNFKLFGNIFSFQKLDIWTLTLFFFPRGAAQTTHGSFPVFGDGVQKTQFRPLKLDTLDTSLGERLDEP